MTAIEDANPNELILALAKELEGVKEITPPEWAKFVKTGMHKERPPVQSNWWYIRSAAILRTVYGNGPVGVAKLRSKYGGKKNRGTKPERFKKGSGNIIRKILQQLQTAGFIKLVEKDIHKGRVIEPKGHALLQKIANSVGTAKPVKKVKPKKEVKEKEKPKEEALKEEVKEEMPKDILKVEAPKKEKVEEKSEETKEEKAEKPKEAKKEEK